MMGCAGTGGGVFQGPDFLNGGLLDVDDAGVGEAVGEQRFGFFESGAVDDTILLRLQSCAQRLGQFRMLGEDQQRFHFSSGVASVRKSCCCRLGWAGK
jgi:hypothetical protein